LKLFFSLEMKYNYVIFNNLDGSVLKPDKDGYYSICLEDLKDISNVQIVSCPLENKNLIWRVFYRIHNYGKLMSLFSWIPRDIWYPFYFESHFESNNSNLCFVLIANLELEYLKYLKRRFPKAKFVKFYRDLVSTKQRYHDLYKNSNIIDYWITYDEGEAKKYNMLYHNEIESKASIKTDNKVLYDVFFAGRAKERLKKVVDVYDYLSSKGINCYFYITGVEKKNQIKRDGIKYAGKLMKYRDMLICNSHARCLLEINQDNAVGYTSRFLESVMFDKKLLTDNMSIRQSHYYDSKFIQCFNTISDINIDFIINDIKVDYNYQGDFSPVKFISFLDEVLK